MSVKILEGENLEALIEKAKTEYGNDIEILYYEVETRTGLLPFRKKKHYRLFFKEAGKNEEETKALKEELETLKALLSELKEEIKQVPESSRQDLVSPYLPPSDIPSHIKSSVPVSSSVNFHEFTGDALELLRLLESKNVFPDVAREIVEPACGLDLETGKLDLSVPTLREALEKGIAEKIKFTGRISVKDRPRVVAFVGPTGVGKTTNLFKIASDLVINRQLKVGVVSIDTFKVGAIQQGRMYANILNIPFFTVSEGRKLKETLASLTDVDVILIDTVGRSHYDYWRLGEIKAILHGSERDMEVNLVISCNYSNEEALEVVNRYRSIFPVTALLLTKIDETRKPGILLNLPVKTELSLSYLSTGQRVPEDIKLLTPRKVADYLLGDL
ncbi:flagellar biosynthesis protein FlhF [Desulfurobacterium sp.]